eukprot:1632562-Amphidinium_carterae.1
MPIAHLPSNVRVAWVCMQAPDKPLPRYAHQMRLSPALEELLQSTLRPSISLPILGNGRMIYNVELSSLSVCVLSLRLAN